MVIVLIIALPVSYVGLKVSHKIIKKINAPQRYNPSSPVAPKDGTSIFIASSLDRVFQDGKTLVKPTFTSSASISLARNEYESFQVIVQPEDKDLHAVELDISNLVNTKTGTVIEKANVSWRVVGYVPTMKPYYPVKFIGLWPDPLLLPQKVDINSKMTRPFWVTVNTSAETAAGDYQGSINVLSHGTVLQTIPLTVHVYNFILPKESHLKTAFDFYGHLTRKVYPQKDKEYDSAYKARLDELNDKFLIMMIQYRMNPVLNIDPMSQADLGRVDRYLVYGLNNFSIC